MTGISSRKVFARCSETCEKPPFRGGSMLDQKQRDADPAVIWLSPSFCPVEPLFRLLPLGREPRGFA
jgi:hypothetical protein